MTEEVSSVPKTKTMKLSNGTAIQLKEMSALDVIDWQKSDLTTDNPDQKLSFEGTMFQVWLSARDRKRDGTFSPTFQEFLDSWPAVDLRNADLIQEAIEFINLPFTDTDKVTSTD